MEKVFLTAKIIAAVMVAFCFGSLGRLFWVMPDLVKEESAQTRRLVDTQLGEWRHTTDDQLTAWRAATAQQLTDMRGTLNTRMASIETTTDNRLASIEAQTFQRANILSESIDRNLTSVAGGVNNLTQTYAAIPGRADAYLKPFTDCNTNDFCWPNLVTDSMVSFRAAGRDTSMTMQTVSTILPVVAKDIRSSTNAFATQFPVIAQNTTNITANIDRLTKPKWYDRLLGVAVNGSMVWFNVNRALVPSVTVTK